MVVYLLFLLSCWLRYSASNYFPKIYNPFSFLSRKGRCILSDGILLFTFVFLFWNYGLLTAVFLGFFKFGLVHGLLPIAFKIFEKYAC